MTKRMTRREFLLMSGMAMAAASLPLAGLRRVAAQTPTSFKQAPMLDELVKAGTLPPVEARLPKVPAVVVPTNEVGKYGGTIRAFMLNQTDNPAIGNFLNYGLLHVPRDLEQFVSNLPLNGWDSYLTEAYEWNADATQLTIKLRDGLKWSDGAPFTSEDVMFRWYDMLMDKEFIPTPPASLFINGEAIVLEAPDALTLVFKFPAPFANFPFVWLRESHFTLYPKHYLMQWHPRYTKTATYQDLQEKSSIAALQPGIPSLTPWVIKTSDTTGILMERNPYFGVVDTEGNQLPYADYYHAPFVGTQQNGVLKAIAGEVDVVERNIQLFDQLPTLKENEARGDYKLLFWRGTAFTAGTLINFNYNLKDPENPELFDLLRNKDFRVALSVALDRADINDTLYYGLGRPTSYGLSSKSPYWDEEMSTITQTNAEYDLARAESLLDGLGLTKNADGIRQFPSGKPVSIILDVASEITMHLKVAEMVVRSWQALGINVTLNASSRSLVFERIGNRSFHAFIWGIDANEIPLVRYDFEVMSPMYSEASIYTDGVVPPEGQQALWDLRSQIYAEVDPDKSRALHKEVAKYRVDWMFNIHLLGDLPVLIVRHNRMGNIPDEGISLQNVIYEKPEQFYIKS
ncbi:MAG: ABC transporter substrate-binding protein [Anaerolineae bacterium]|nr:ABC transporter substrate-binding protein [Anaerolineae bacterium]